MATPVLTNVLAGPYTATYAGPSGSNPSVATLGTIGEKGIREIIRVEEEEIGADLLGGSIVDGVYRGGQCFLEFDLLEVKYANVKAMLNPYAATPGVEGEMGVPGMMTSAKAGQIVLTPAYTTNTSAGADTTPVRTYGLVKIAANFDITRLLASRARIIPIRLRCFPYLGSGGQSSSYIWYSKSALP